MKATKKIVFFGAMSSILLIGAVNAETHVATKGYSDTHVAGAEGPKTTSADTNKIIKTTSTDGTQYELVDMPTAYREGTNVQISSTGVISATDSQYKSGTNVTVDTTADTDGKYKINVATATDSTLGVVKAGANVTIDTDGSVNATNTTYTNGLNTTITGNDNEINAYIATGATNSAVSITNNTTDMTQALDVKVDGTTIKKDLTDGTLSAVDTTYTNGLNTTITGDDNEINAYIATSATNSAVSVTNNTTDMTQALDVKVDGMTITKGTDGTLSAIDTTYTGSNDITIDSTDNNAIKLNATECPAGYRCALTTNTDGSLKWEPLTSSDATGATNTSYDDQ